MSQSHPSPRGLRRWDHDGREWIDAVAGRASVFGFGFEPIVEAIQSAAEGYLGDGGELLDEPRNGEDALLQQLGELLDGSQSVAADSLFLCASADEAVETAVRLARTWQPQKRFRTISMLDSDHGRSGVCRIASGRPELHEFYGPMMAGFAHVPAGDIDALKATIDDQIAAVLLSPVGLARGAQPLDADYLSGVRQLCDENAVLLMIDESRLCFGSAGGLLAFHEIAEIHADVVMLSGGIFAGLAGGLVIASERVTGSRIVDTARFPLLAAVAGTTLSSMKEYQLPQSARERMQTLAESLAQRIADYEFVRDVHTLGMTIGIETDVSSEGLVAAAAGNGLRVEPAGDTAIRLQPPLLMDDHDFEALVSGVGQAMDAIEREATEISA